MTRKTVFEGKSWFKFNNLGLAIGRNFKFYTSVAKGLKLKVIKLFEANSYVCRNYRNTGEKWEGSQYLGTLDKTIQFWSLLFCLYAKKYKTMFTRKWRVCIGKTSYTVNRFWSGMLLNTQIFKWHMVLIIWEFFSSYFTCNLHFVFCYKILLKSKALTK